MLKVSSPSPIALSEGIYPYDSTAYFKQNNSEFKLNKNKLIKI